MNFYSKSFALIFFAIWCGASAAEEGPVASYTFESTITDDRDPYIEFFYTNKSTVAHCIRAADLDFALFSDDIYVFNSSGAPAKYIGPTRQFSDLTPKSFKIIPPGTTFRSGVKIMKYYKIGSGKTLVAYTLPVIPCSVVNEKYINIPPPEFIKGKIKIPSENQKHLFKEFYPEWIQDGFLATSKQIEFKK